MKFKILFLILFAASISGCKEYIDFEIERTISGYKFSFIIVVIALILSAISSSNKKK